MGPSFFQLARKFLAPAAVVLIFTGCQIASANAGPWTKLKNPNPGYGSGNMILLTDGTIMVQSGQIGGDPQYWTKLTPDSAGSYVNGTWSELAPMTTPRLFFGSNILPNGKLLVLGGEYSGPNLDATFTNTGEIYDPIADSWSPIPDFPETYFGDDPTMLLPNGKVLCGYIIGAKTYLFDPKTNSWSPGGTKLRNDPSDEETWALLPDGSVLSYSIFASIRNQPGSAQRYIPATNTWVDAGTVPVPLSDPSVGYELGPMAVLPDGRVIQVGANENIALYDPKTNTWTAGPRLPDGMGADDAPGAMLPNGHFVFLADFYLFNGPTHLFDFDYKTNKLTDLTADLPQELQDLFAQLPAFVQQMLVLPNGHLLLGTGVDFWEYSPTGSPQNTWIPVIASITKGTANSVSAYNLTGFRLTGISQGSSFGDDVENDTNYPIVRLTSNQSVQYARTTNWTPGISKPGDTKLSSVQFSLPRGFQPGVYRVAVIANGMASREVSVYLADTNNYVQANYDPQRNEVTLRDDALNNSVQITQQSGKLIVQGLAGTLIGDPDNNATIVTFNATNPSITANFGNTGNNRLTLTGVSSPAVNAQFGPGNDALSILFSTITSLVTDGGPGTDTLTVVGSKVTQQQSSNFP